VVVWEGVGKGYREPVGRRDWNCGERSSVSHPWRC
jgi:hypothetical protein